MNAPKRFWTEAAVVAEEGGWTISLNGKPVRTPLKSAFLMPTRTLAEAVAGEWQTQGESIDPASMPQTRYVNSAIDGVAPNRAKIVSDIAAYGGSDLLCYRAAHPEELIARQAERWDPLLDWARERYDASLVQIEGVMPVAQPAQSVARLGEAVSVHPDFELAALHDLVAIAGSLVLGLAVSDGRLSAGDAYALSRVDEDWQAEQWGADAEAAETAARKSAEFIEAARHLALLRES